MKKTFLKEYTHFFRKVFLVFGVLFVGLGVFYLYIAYFLPLPDVLTIRQDIPTTKIYDRNGILLYELLRPDEGRRTSLSLREVPEKFIQATLSAEDINFYHHSGVDFGAIFRALSLNIQAEKIVSGASTIPQQLIRNLMGTERRRTLEGKILEALYAIRISHQYSKDEILEQYLNRIYYGNLSYGAQSAAQNYFGKNLHDLDLAESALLAGLPQSPSVYNPLVNFTSAKKRQIYVLGQMVQNGFITEIDKAQSIEEKLTFRKQKTDMKAPHFVTYVLNQLEEQYGEDQLYLGGLSIQTTLDYQLQQKAEDIIKRQVERLAEQKVSNGALISIDVQTGQILAWVGSKDYFDPDIQGAVDVVTSFRQPGSSIKPFNYLLAFEKGWSPATVIYDIPTQFKTNSGAYSPKNYDLDYHGPVRARVALGSSYNIPAVKTLEYVGPENLLAFFQRVGLKTLEDSPEFYGLALTLGGAEVRLLDLTNAYRMIANYGFYSDESSILQVRDSEGKILFSWQPVAKKYVLGNQGKEHAYQIINILSDPLARLEGFGEDSILEISRPAAVKTGTTRNFRDNLTVGFTPEIVTGVWVGNADATTMENISGIDGAAPIWANFMEEALEFQPRTDFFVPPGLQNIELCSISGFLPTPECPNLISELLTAQQIPQKMDNYFKKFTLEKSSGRIIAQDCLKNYLPFQYSEKVLIDYPTELQRWATERELQLPNIIPCDAHHDYSGNYTDDQNASIKIVSPRDLDEYLVDYSMPIEGQKIPFRIDVPSDTKQIDYFLDGKFLATAATSPYTYLWPPVQGEHFVSARLIFNSNKEVMVPEVRFFVR